MRVRHPLADDRPLPSVVTGPDGEDYRITDGTVDAPDRAAKAIAAAWARRFGADAEALLGGEADTCEVVKTDGEVCGRDLPCRYHSEED